MVLQRIFIRELRSTMRDDEALSLDLWFRVRTTKDI